MKKLFIHQPLFRLLSPLFSGIIIYLLILLLNNNTEQIQNEFFNEELYVCIVLSYIIQEFSRLLLLLFAKFTSIKSEILALLFQVSFSLILCTIIVTVAVIFYFKYILGFTATTEEIYVFNSIFCGITLLYILLYVSHQYLYKINSKKLEQEEFRKLNIEDDFKQFRKGINPNLLFDSFESLLVLIQSDKEKCDDFIDHLATIYRYILSAKEKQLVSFIDEISALEELIALLNYLPFRKINLINSCKENFLVVPGSLLFLIEQIVRTTIISAENKLVIELKEYENSLVVFYEKNDKIIEKLNIKMLSELERTYSIYSADSIKISENNDVRNIKIPKLQIDTKI